ncbi:hypothetical protein B0H14DRAFT_3540117 [Mycena olivaceomarginata]|nr:hypothetical protein B0H14DRAFT_3540117 [Mycena olivaceomarginata]
MDTLGSTLGALFIVWCFMEVTVSQFPPPPPSTTPIVTITHSEEGEALDNIDDVYMGQQLSPRPRRSGGRM